MKLKIYEKALGIYRFAMYILLPLAGGGLVWSSCSDPNEDSLFVTPTTEETEMAATDILERDIQDYSLWIELLKKANYYNALKDGSANATVFCPNNQAMTRFLSEQGVSTVDELPESYAKSVVRVHIINNKRYTDTQIDQYAEQGRNFAERGYEIPDTTLLGNNLTLRYGRIETNVDDAQRHDDNILSADSIFINNQAKLGKFTAITCANAVLFEMDEVIEPLVETIMDVLDADKDTYSIFASAVHECGYDSIASLTSSISYTMTGTVVTNYSFTCLAVTDDVYRSAGITDVASLKSYLSSNFTGKDAELSNYISYHFLPRSYTKEQLLDYESSDPEADEETRIYDTQFTGQAITINRKGGVDLINDEIALVRTNIKTRNGYIHRVGNVMPVFHPKPVRVAWDFLNQPDIISFVNAWGAANSLGNVFSTPIDATMRDVDLSDEYFDGNYGTITSFTYQLNETKARSNTYRRIGYKKDALSGASSQYGAYMDNFMTLNLGFAGWIQFTTPTIIAGRYKIVLHYCKDINHNNFINGGTLTRFELDDRTTMSYLYKGMTRLPRYQLAETTIFGSVDFEGSGSHTFKITLNDVEAKNNSNYHLSIDYLEFVPI
jgi:uncharacterized surface protein with fasciclin (FAS1) repeats